MSDLIYRFHNPALAAMAKAAGAVAARMSLTEPILAPIPAPAQYGQPAQFAPTPSLDPRLSGFFSQADVDARLAEVRKEEKDKLYSAQKALQDRLDAADAKEKVAQDAAALAQKTADEDAQRARIDELAAKDAVIEVRREMQAQLDVERQARLQYEALLQREQEYGRLSTYRQQSLTANMDRILPELRDYLTGAEGDQLTSTNEVDARAADLVRRTEEILNNVRGTQDAQNRGAPMIGVNQGAPPGYDPAAALANGQLDPSKLDYANMGMADYIRMRPLLPTGKAGAVQSRGLYG